MTPHLQKLLNISNVALCPQAYLNLFEAEAQPVVGRIDLETLLKNKNGFYAFESALLIRPFSCLSTPLGIREWNAPSLWKYEYNGVLDQLICFAEDIFGGQFALGAKAIVAIDPETGESEKMAETLEEWADLIFNDRDYQTGYPLAKEWQTKYGSLPYGYRLSPKVPFVTGGKYEVENLHAIVDVEGMRFRGSIARQLRGVAEGDFVTLELDPTSNNN